MIPLLPAEAGTTTGLLSTAQCTLLLANSPPSCEYFMLTVCSFGSFEFVRIGIDGLV